MKLTRTVLLLIILAVAGLSTVTQAQTYKRHALIEEGTGTWCQWCAYGGYDMDSIEKAMGETLVAISWHGPKNYGEPMYIAAMDSVASGVGVTGYPFASVGRRTAFSGAPVPPGINNQWYSTASNDARQAPIVDFRVSNASYRSNSVDFDLDVTPFKLSAMPSEDTCTYVLVAVVTEDGIVSAQQKADLNGGSPTTVDNYVHHNVARAVGGKANGDAFVLGTKASVTWPIRKHYHISTANADWTQDSLRVKAFVARVSKAGKGTMYLDAGQTTYITKLPSSPAPALWAILPRTGDQISSDSVHVPIVWNKGGGAGVSVKMDYSIDGGTTWTPIGAGIGVTCYEWTIPSEAYGKQVMVRVTDGSNASLVATTGSFSIAPKPYFSVNAPAKGDIVYTNSTTQVLYQGVGSTDQSITLDVSRDSGATWTKIGNTTGGTSYNWTVTGPTTNGAIAMVRVRDSKGSTGISAPFTIADSGKITGVTVDAAPVGTPGAATTIHWTASGYYGETLDIDYSTDGQVSWAQIAHGLAGTATSTPWTLPATNKPNVVVRVSGMNGRVAGYSAPFAVGAAGVSETAASAMHLAIAPNPTSSYATVHYTLTEPAAVTFVVQDLVGREVSRMGVGMTGAGEHTMTFDGSSLAAGTYEYTLIAGASVTHGKLSIIR